MSSSSRKVPLVQDLGSSSIYFLTRILMWGGIAGLAQPDGEGGGAVDRGV
jgi:hypothetical protein